MKYFFDKTTYLWFHKCTKFLYCTFLKFPMGTEAWNPAVRARSWIQAKTP